MQLRDVSNVGQLDSDAARSSINLTITMSQSVCSGFSAYHYMGIDRLGALGKTEAARSVSHRLDWVRLRVGKCCRIFDRLLLNRELS